MKFAFSANFDGIICAMKPEDSWVCKWQVGVNTDHSENQSFLKNSCSFLRNLLNFKNLFTIRLKLLTRFMHSTKTLQNA